MAKSLSRERQKNLRSLFMSGFNAAVKKITENPSVASSTKKITESPFFTFSKPPLEFLEKAKLFKLVFVLVCIVMAVTSLVYPFIILGRVISSGYFNFGIKYVAAFIFVWLAIAAASWLGFHLWWSRRKKAEEISSADFIVLPFFAELLRTYGEWLGIMFGIIGAFGGLFALIFLGRFSSGMLAAILFGTNLGGPLEPILGGLAGNLNNVIGFVLSGAVIILGPIIGFFNIFISRFFAEMLRVLAAIANNTKETSANTKCCASASTETPEYATVPHAAEPTQDANE
jgi:hypothetical protein